MLLKALLALTVGLATVQALPSPTKTYNTEQKGPHKHVSAIPHCFPALGFQMPSSVPDSLDDWWCDPDIEYAFLGFSYEITACQSLTQLTQDFLDIRQRFHSRYIRLYGTCDTDGYYNNVIEAAWTAGLGVHALVWFGFTGDTSYLGRRDALFSALHSNPKAGFVTRAVQFGSEPLYDSAIAPEDLVWEVNNARQNLSALQIPITVSEMAYGYQKDEDIGSLDVLAAVDFVNAHMLPFFSQQASIANNSWPIVDTDLDWFLDNIDGKKVIFSENGWPSKTSSGVQPNSPSAVADVQNERDYYNLLDSQCSFFKYVPGGGVGWFAHIYTDQMEPGYGIYNINMTMKFPFLPRNSC